MNKICYQINLQRHFGGGEVYTSFFTRALRDLGWDSVIFIDRTTNYWPNLDLSSAQLIPVNSPTEILQYLPKQRSLTVSHQQLDPSLVESMRPHLRCCFAHMPLYQRSATPFTPYDVVFGVSQYVLDTATKQGLTNCYPTPFLGVAELNHTINNSVVRRRPVYDWDKRKGRDTLLSHVYPLYWSFAPKPIFEKRPGLTLGIVSRITPIKQFPVLFKYLAPLLQQHPDINLEIFGAGGYASVRDLKRALSPIAAQTRFWGHQHNTASIYPQLDYLLTGLPEKEALGLNVLEAQALGTPILAPNAPPFTETVVDGQTGHLYTDPRQDNGEHLASLLKQLTQNPPQLHPEKAQTHLEKFSYRAFTERCRSALANLCDRSW